MLFSKKKEYNSLKKIEIGNCEKVCPQNLSFFELDIITDQFPGHFSGWLVGSNITVMTYVDKYNDTITYHYFGKFISLIGCMIVELLDMERDGGTYYNISLDRNIIKDFQEAKGFIEKIDLTDCSKECFQNQMPFELYHYRRRSK
jgi:hypothetical protein